MMRSEKEMMSTIMNWANNDEAVRTVIMTSSRTSIKSKIDFLSDYDIEVYTSDIEGFKKNDDWLDEFGDVMVRWPLKPKSTGDEDWITRLIIFDDRNRIDFQITELKEIDVSRYINGFKVLIDKDDKASQIPEPTYREFIINKPSQEEFETVINEYWWDVYYVPKYLWRDELPFAKFQLDNIMRYHFLHKVIDWYIGLKNNWDVETGALGKKYKALLDDKTWQEFEASYGGGGVEENWNALLNSTALFRRLANEICEELGYDYPKEVDDKVMKFCRDIMNTPK